MAKFLLVEKGSRAARIVVREGDLRMICQVKPRATRSWKAGCGGETVRFSIWLSSLWAARILARAVFSVL